MRCKHCGDEIEFVKLRPFRWGYVHLDSARDHEAEPREES